MQREVETCVTQWLAQPDDAQPDVIALADPAFSDALAAALKARADHALRADLTLAKRCVQRLYALAELTANPLYRALGLRAEGNVLGIGEGDHRAAIDCYDEAAALYHAQDARADEAAALTGKLVALDRLGRYAEALELGAWIAATLESDGRWFMAAGANLNLFPTLDRLGRDAEALAYLERAEALYTRAGEAGAAMLPLVALNRAILLRNRGQFAASLAASQTAETLLQHLARPVEAARARQASGITYFVLGRYNEALRSLDEALDVFWRDGRQRDAMLAELYLTQCLLELRRFAEVLTRSQRLRGQFAQLETPFECAQALLNEATAYTGLRRYAEASASLAEARQRFAQAGNQTWVMLTDLQQAMVWLAQGDAAAAYALAQTCHAAAIAARQPVNAARAQWIAAQAALAQGELAEGESLARAALEAATSRDALTLQGQARATLAAAAQQQGDLAAALAHYEQAIQVIERLQGQLITEFRADFVADKHSLYEAAVALCLETGAVERGWQYTERARSRALLDLLAYRLDLSFRPHHPQDAPLVAEITALRAQLNQRYRRAKDQPTAEALAAAIGEEATAQQEALALEAQLAALWHKLLIRNAAYRQEAALWQTQSAALCADLPPDTALVEFFPLEGQWVAFVVTARGVVARRLPVTQAQVARWVQLWQVNLKAWPGSALAQQPGLLKNAQGILQRLHAALLAPLAAELAPYARWFIVPHGGLHYLPFHALHDGESYLIQQRDIAYLPSASVLPYCAQPRVAGEGWLALGHAHGGRLPFALEEARAVAELGGGRAYLEADATLAALRERAGACRVLHLAVHGDFRADNPLFSGLTLADGDLTTLDVFNLRLKASLVTLSACQTGRSVVGGGDELLGLMRAFLYAGAASLVVSLWTVADAATAEWMATFYRALSGGATKSAAAREAQVVWLRQARGMREHPYYWAPFILVGDPGAL